MSSSSQLPQQQQQQQRIQSDESTDDKQQRLYSRTSAVAEIVKNAQTFEETHLARNGHHLLDGLDRYVVPSLHDGHPLTVYGYRSLEDHHFGQEAPATCTRTPLLLLHGRTWSSVPVYHLLGGPAYAAKGVESRSLMEALYAKGVQPYALDFRGFGGTPMDETYCVEPYRCVADTHSVLEWIAARHRIKTDSASPAEFCSEQQHATISSTFDTQPNTQLPALLGWSQGALVAQLVAQKLQSKRFLSKLILYGSIYDPLQRYPRDPLYRSTTTSTVANTGQTNNGNNSFVETFNDYDSAIEDFTVEGTIPPEPAKMFAEAALISDPIKAKWKHTYQFNNLDPGRVHVPTLVVAGDQDPYAPLHVQQELFCNLGRDNDRTWTILSGCDHAVHLLDERYRLVNSIVSFLNNNKRT